MIMANWTNLPKVALILHLGRQPIEKYANVFVYLNLFHYRPRGPKDGLMDWSLAGGQVLIPESRTMQKPAFNQMVFLFSIEDEAIGSQRNQAW